MSEKDVSEMTYREMLTEIIENQRDIIGRNIAPGNLRATPRDINILVTSANTIKIIAHKLFIGITHYEDTVSADWVEDWNLLEKYVCRMRKKLASLEPDK